MRLSTEDVPAPVLLLADNLDAALAASEDLLQLKLSYATAAVDANAAQKCADERAQVAASRSMELAFVTRVLKSRESALELAKTNEAIAPIARLFASGTSALVDAVEDLRDGMMHVFEVGDGVAPYLRSRGLLADDTDLMRECLTIPVTEEFLVLGRIRLGSAMDLVASLLDVLELHYPLYTEQSAAEDASSDLKGADAASLETRLS